MSINWVKKFYSYLLAQAINRVKSSTSFQFSQMNISFYFWSISVSVSFILSITLIHWPAFPRVWCFGFIICSVICHADFLAHSLRFQVVFFFPICLGKCPFILNIFHFKITTPVLKYIHSSVLLSNLVYGTINFRLLKIFCLKDRVAELPFEVI